MILHLDTKKNTQILAKPVLKWAGGKTQLLSALNQYYPIDLGKTVRKYIEPFFGGGAVFFDLYNAGMIDSAIIMDKNPELVLLYQTLQKHPEHVIENLSKIQHQYSCLNHDKQKEYYYAIRYDFNQNIKENYLSLDVLRAAHIIFLNRTCFNGLFRVNKKRQFNVPHGDYKNPRILDSENIYAVWRALQISEIVQQDFEYTAQIGTQEHFIYYDPPYKPLSPTSSFTAYSGLFDDAHQIRLSNMFKRLHFKHTRQMLSNSDPFSVNGNDFFDKLYSEFNIHRIIAKRNINSKATKRGGISELIITNYEDYHYEQCTTAGRSCTKNS